MSKNICFLCSVGSGGFLSVLCQSPDRRTPKNLGIQTHNNRKGSKSTKYLEEQNGDEGGEQEGRRGNS
jgi:hypothetical protein